MLAAEGGIPLSAKEYEKCDYFFTFEDQLGSADGVLEERVTNAYDLFAKKFFIEMPVDHSLPVQIPDKYKAKADEMVRMWKRPVVGIQPEASAKMRTWPTPYLAELIKGIDSRGYAVLLLESVSTIENLVQTPEMKGLQVLTPNGSMSMAAALCERCKLVVAPDSMGIYVAESLGVPVVAGWLRLAADAPVEVKMRQTKDEQRN